MHTRHRETFEVRRRYRLAWVITQAPPLSQELLESAPKPGGVDRRLYVLSQVLLNSKRLKPKNRDMRHDAAAVWLSELFPGQASLSSRSKML